MYEEEDADLPMQYRRLTAHLHTSNTDFDRRLAAYLTNHVAMRTALNGGYLLQQQQERQRQQQQAQKSLAQAQTETVVDSPTSDEFSKNIPNANNFHLQAPPVRRNRTQSFSPYGRAAKAHVHARAASLATPRELSQQIDNSAERRQSLPVPQGRHATNESVVTSEQGQQTYPSPFSVGSADGGISGGCDDIFSTRLPHDVQQLLEPTLYGDAALNDEFSFMFNSGYNLDSKQQKDEGIDQTLAPGTMAPVKESEPSAAYISPPESTGLGETDGTTGRGGKVDMSGFCFPDPGLMAGCDGEQDWSSLLDGDAWEAGLAGQTTVTG